MASQISQVAQQVLQDQNFVNWMQNIGEQGQKKLQEMFVKTAQENNELAQMAQEDPESAMMVFAYQVYQQSTEKGNASQTQNPGIQSKNGATTPTPLPKQNNTYPISAKAGAKFTYLQRLNGHCPEGYEVERFLAGGKCNCKKKKPVQLTEELKCGGKKRISKHYDGGILDWIKKMLGTQTPVTNTTSVTNTTTAPAQQTNDTKYGVQRLTSNTSGEGYVDGSFFEGYRGQNGTWADIDWPQGQGKGKRRIVTESNPGVADSLSYRYFNRPVPTRK